MRFRWRIFALGALVGGFGLAGLAQVGAPAPAPQLSSSRHIKTVFLIVLENHNWSEIEGNPNAPFINNTLLPLASHAENYFNPRWIHPSLPNYLYLESGRGFGIKDDDAPAANHQATPNHLVTRLESAGFTWKAYMEGIGGTDCPIADEGTYSVRHDPFVYFDDVTEGLNPLAASCISHIRPLSELSTDILNNDVANYNFIAADNCHNMHTSCDGTDPIAAGDAWLAQVVPLLLSSPAYTKGGAIFITWDEAAAGDGPIGMIVLSHFAKGNGYASWTYHQHSDTLRTLEEIFGLLPPLSGDIADDADLRGLFWEFP